MNPLSQTQRESIVSEFHRDGVALVPGFLAREECEGLRDKTDEIFADEQKRTASELSNHLVLHNPLLYHRDFVELFLREPILSLMEMILGPECRFSGQNVIRNAPGQAISNWHVDDCDTVDFPLPEAVPRHDARIQMPIHWLSVQIPLTDIDVLEDGPTELVRGSHYSGRLPNSQENPKFDGRESEAIFCKAGDAYLFNHQIWHRGRPNQSQRTRYVLQLQYARGGTHAYHSQGAPQSAELDEMLQGADQRTLRVLGKTAPTYGL